jgi:hypothetical protein
VTRRIHRLLLRGGSASEQQHAKNVLVDALRTASLPGVGPGRVLVVRSLDLGRISPRRAPQALALHITEQVRKLALQALWWSEPAAESAPAVWFADRAQARAAFLRRRVLGPAPAAWFWRSAVEDPRPDDPVETLLVRWLSPQPRLAARALPPLVTMARQVQALVELGEAVAVLRRLPVAALAAWLAPARPSPAPEPELALLAPPPPPEPWRPVLRWAAEQPQEILQRWVGLVALVAVHPSWVARPELVPLAQALVRSVARPVPQALSVSRPPQESPRASPLRLRALPAPAPLAPRPRPSPRRPARELAPTPTLGGEPLEVPSPSSPQELPARRPPSWLSPRDLSGPSRARFPPPPPLVDPAWTEWGGLLFLVHVLERLGLSELHQRRPALLAQAFGWRVLDLVGARWGMAPDDPVLRAIAPRQEPEPLDREPFVAHPRCWALFSEEPLRQAAAPQGHTLLSARQTWLARWRGELPDALEVQDRLVLPGPPVGDDVLLSAHAESWAGCVLRWCEQIAILSAQEIAQRPALVSATPTHVDLVLPASTIALSVRRWALDTDPGWVPWLGRVIAFHYVEDDELPEVTESS